MYVVKVRPPGARRALLLTESGDFTTRRENALVLPEGEARARAAALSGSGTVAYITR